jgi:pimeloyl-ACP methyl ester carboxylesterase
MEQKARGAVDPKLDPTHHGFESHHLAVNGIKIHVACAGGGRPLVLLHGWPEFWLAWAPCMRRLADRFQLLAPDLRGLRRQRQADERAVARGGPGGACGRCAGTDG